MLEIVCIQALLASTPLRHVFTSAIIVCKSVEILRFADGILVTSLVVAAEEVSFYLEGDESMLTID